MGLDRDRHELGLDTDLEHQVRRHQVGPARRALAGRTPDHVEPGGHGPEHPAPEPVVVVGIASGRDLATGHPKMPPESGFVVVVVDTVWPERISALVNALVMRVSACARSRADLANSAVLVAPAL